MHPELSAESFDISFQASFEIFADEEDALRMEREARAIMHKWQEAYELKRKSIASSELEFQKENSSQPASAANLGPENRSIDAPSACQSRYLIV